VSPAPAIAVIDGKETMVDDITKTDTMRIQNEDLQIEKINLVQKRPERLNTEDNLPNL
jgi:hypothetical protein